MASGQEIRWGILGTAHIVTQHFLPGLRASGGVAFVAGGRDRDRTQRFAADHGIERAAGSYADLLADDRVDAVYVALPNSLHAEWTMASLRAGKAVLCEKPLCLTAEETRRVLEVARVCPQPLWEAYVFPFRDQTSRLLELATSSAIGELREIHSTFHYPLASRHDIRLDPTLGGGVLLDAGGYPVRLARLLFGAEAVSGTAVAERSPEGVEQEAQGVLSFPGGRHLIFSCAMFRRYSMFCRLLGSEGEIRISRPFHPRIDDTVEIHRDGEVEIERPNRDDPSFAAALRHIHAVLRREEAPRHLAVDEALGNARAVDLLKRSFESKGEERPGY